MQVCAEHKKPAKLLKHLNQIKVELCQVSAVYMPQWQAQALGLMPMPLLLMPAACDQVHCDCISCMALLVYCLLVCLAPDSLFKAACCSLAAVRAVVPQPTLLIQAIGHLPR